MGIEKVDQVDEKILHKESHLQVPTEYLKINSEAILHVRPSSMR